MRELQRTLAPLARGAPHPATELYTLAVLSHQRDTVWVSSLKRDSDLMVSWRTLTRGGGRQRRSGEVGLSDTKQGLQGSRGGRHVLRKERSPVISVH